VWISKDAKSTIRAIVILQILVLLYGLNGCHTSRPIQYSADKVLKGSFNGSAIEHVVIFAIDGLKQDTLLHYLMLTPTTKPGGLKELLGAQADAAGVSLTNGVAVRRAVSVFPSYTYPAWTSMLTGLFPGAHGITGNSLFFREREIARYYTEYHVDAVKVQMEKDFLSNDISDQIRTLYEYIGQGGGQSIVVHHMITRGSGQGAVPLNNSTMWSYQQNRNRAVDENTVWEAVKALQDFNGETKLGTELKLPSVMTIYFSGLDHAEHIHADDPERGRLEYLSYLDSLIAKFIAGDRAITRNDYATPLSDPTQADPLDWRGLQNEPVMQRTVFILVSDHGHTPIDWDKALGIEDLREAFDDFSSEVGRDYHLETPTLVDDSASSLVKSMFGYFHDGTISSDANIVATLNGGSLGFYVKPDGGAWTDPPNYKRDILPILEHLLLTLHKNHQAPEAVLYKQEGRYLFIPYRYDGSKILLLPGVAIEQSPLNDAAYPMAERRLDGLAWRLPTDPMSAPDIVLLADRTKRFTYLNKRDWRVLEGLDMKKHRHFHSDHGHLNGADSLVPMIFVRGGYKGKEALPTICEASLVDITPTVLDILGKLPAFVSAVNNRPDDVKGHSLKEILDRLVAHAHPPGGQNTCPSRMKPSIPPPGG
jgi:predicted AlkP superfamily pyrophosphatase or phosphodiesterase